MMRQPGNEGTTARAMWVKVLALIPEGSPQRQSLQHEIDSLGQ